MDGWMGREWVILRGYLVGLDWIGLVSCRSFLIKSMMDIGGGGKNIYREWCALG